MNVTELPSAPQQAQRFRDIHVEGHGHSLVINQIVQIASDVVRAQPYVDLSPYVGLRRFEERDQDLFFGRDAVVGKLLTAVRDQRFTLVAGASGSGKSSLVRAGLLPTLQKRLARLRVLTLVPDRDPFARLHAALLNAGFDLDQVTTATVARDETLRSLCSTLRTPDESWLIFIDQFEEIFTLCTDTARRKAFLDGLCRLVDSSSEHVNVVAAMRSDFFDRFDPYPQLLERAQPPFFVTSPSPEELRLCIEQPAARHGVTFEAGLVSEILRNVDGQPGALPLLSYTLDLLWKKDEPHDNRTLNAVHYRALGGITGALRQRADELYQQRATDRQRSKKEPRDPAQRGAMRRAFLRLLDLSEQSENARPISKRTPLTEFPPDEQALIAELADDKLLVTSRREDVSIVEVAHESLLSAWPRLTDWIAEARDAIYTRNRLQTDAAVWEKRQQSNGDQAHEELWTGTRLQVALDQDERGEFARLGGLSSLVREFLDAGRELRHRRLLDDRQRREELERLLQYSQQRQQEAEQRELDLLVEHGRQLLVEKDRLMEAAFFLQRALERGSKSPSLPYLLKQAMIPIDANRMILRGHQGALTCAVFSPDGQRIVTASEDKTARLWDTQSGRLLLVLEGHIDSVTGASFSPDGRRIVTASRDETVRLWDTQRGQCLLALQGRTKRCTSAAFSPDGRRIVTATGDETAQLWDAQNGRLLFTLQDHTEPLVGAEFDKLLSWEKDRHTSAAFSPDGHRIATSSIYKTGRLWDAHTGQILLDRLHGKKFVAFSPDGRRIVTTEVYNEVRIEDAHSGRTLGTLRGHTDLVTGAAFSPDGRRIVTSSMDKTVRIWDAHSGLPMFSLQGHNDGVNSAAYSPDGYRIVTASQDHTARLWDAQGGLQIFSLQGRSDDRRIITMDHDHPVRRWYVLDRMLETDLKWRSFRITTAAFSPDGQRIVTSSKDLAARLWDVHNGTLLVTLRGHRDQVSGASFSPDGRSIITTSADGTARLWNAQSGQHLFTLQGHMEEVTGASFSPDGRRVITSCTDGRARLFDAQSGQVLLTLQAHAVDVNSVSFSPDGYRIATSSVDKSARLWDAKNGQLLLTLQGHAADVNSVAFSADGRRIVTSSVDKSVRLWDAQNGQFLLALQGHMDAVTSASFSPDQGRVVTSSIDRTARLWDASSGQLLHILQGHTGGVTSAAFSPDGRSILTAGSDDTARVWIVEAETRTPAQIAKVLHCWLSFRLVGAAMIPSEPTVATCQWLPEPPPQPLRWDQRDSLLWSGVYALQNDQPDAARSAFREVRPILTAFKDNLSLAKLDIAVTALESAESAPCPSTVLDIVRVRPTPEEVDWGLELAEFVQNALFRPHWAIVILEHLETLAPPQFFPFLQARRVEALLSASQVAEALQHGVAVFGSQTDQMNKPVIAALLWLATGQLNPQAGAPHKSAIAVLRCWVTGQKIHMEERPSWALRTVGSYVELRYGTELRWTFNGIRRFFLNQPSSPARTQALELFTLLEQPKTDETVQQLAKLLGVPIPKAVVATP